MQERVKFRLAVTGILAAVSMLVFVACGSAGAGSGSTNVKTVPGTNNVQWVCHDTTILYFFSGTVTAVKDAPQCKLNTGN